MINHVRTLLLNQSRGAYGPDFPGEEYVPPTYKPHRLAMSLEMVWHKLFGSRPDRLFLNYRLCQLMRWLHSSEIEQYVLEPDARITYDRRGDLNLFSSAFGTTIVKRSGSPTNLPYLSGHATGDDDAGITTMTWDIEVVSASRVILTRTTLPAIIQDVAYTLTGGLSQAIPLPGNKLTLRIPANSIGARWSIKSVVPPARDIGAALYEIDHMLGAGAARLFGEKDEALLNIWAQHRLSAYRYVALVVGLSRRIEEQPLEAA